MPGSDPVERHADLVRRLIIIGWLFLGGEFGFIVFQLERVRSVDGTRFATTWEQRIETSSFVVLPPNIVVLVPAAVIGVTAAFLARPERPTWLDALLRVTTTIAVVAALLGVAAIVEISMRAGELELGSVFFRLGGVSIALGIAALCRLVDQPEFN